MNVTTCSAAAELSLKHYFTGKPCKNGHIAERLVSNRMCVVCRKEYEATYYAENRQAYAERDKNYYAENRSRIVSRQQNYRAQNRDKLLELSARYREKDREAQRARIRRHYAKNRDAILEKQKHYNRENLPKLAAKTALRRARKLRAMPPWFGEFDELVWREAADLAQRRTIATGFPWQADHMIPLRANDACGLHSASNCQVIPANMNISKGNKLVITEPFEWLEYILS